MLAPNLIRKNPEIVQAEIKKRSWERLSSKDFEKLLELDQLQHRLVIELESLRAEQNKISDDIAKTSEAERKNKIEEARKSAEKIKKLEGEEKKQRAELNKLLAKLPNLSHEEVPQKENKLITEWGNKPEFSFKPKTHYDLAQTNGLIDTQRAAKVSGSRFAYVKGDLVRLHFALFRWALDKLVERGYQPFMTPQLVREKAMFGTGFFPAEEFEVYRVAPQNPEEGEEKELFLVGTSEVTLAGYHADEIIDFPKTNGQISPLRYCAYSSCYRREAGTYGKDTHGIIRQHQFEKLEMFMHAPSEISWNVYEELISIAEEILQELELPYRKLLMHAGELAAPNAMKYDLEVWLPGEARYLETHSGSHDTDFQARRLKIRYKNKDGEIEPIHTLNCTAVTPRLLVAIMENYQDQAGTITVPKVLRGYLGRQKTLNSST